VVIYQVTNYRTASILCYDRSSVCEIKNMEMKLVFLAVLLVLFVLSTEAKRKRKSLEWRPVAPSKLRKRPTTNLRRKIIISDGKKVFGRGNVGKLVNLPPEKTDVSRSEHYIRPELLDKFHKVKDMQDFVRLFKPAGFTLKEEPVLRGQEISKNGGKDAVTVKQTNIYYKGKKFMNVAQDSTNARLCSPRPVFQSLDTLGKLTFPSCAVTKRCGGCCSSAMECVASRKTKKTINVFEFSNFVAARLVQKTLVEHSSCLCQCIVKASDCLPKQTYSSTRCQCQCTRRPQRCPAGKTWSRRECDCKCKFRQVCSSRLQQWDEKNCRCGCIKKACPSGKVRNPENCRCQRRFGDIAEPFRRDFLRESEDEDTDGSSPDDFWGDF